MNKKKIRDSIRLMFAIAIAFIYLPHFIIMLFSERRLIYSDLQAVEHQLNIHIPKYLQLLYQMHNNSYFRTVFYYRIGPVLTLLIGWYRPGNKYFNISNSTYIGPGLKYAHPYATIINAERIGSNFHFLHSTTLGATHKGRPTIGDNVSLGAGVIIIGNISIGDNVVIGAGSVVVKDIPSNCVIAGNPAKIIRML